MVDLFKIPEYNDIIFIILLGGVVSWGFAQLYSQILAGLITAKKLNPPLWWDKPGMRIISVLFGVLAGVLLSKTIVAGLLGAASGTLNAFIVMELKIFVTNKTASTTNPNPLIQPDQEPPTNPPTPGV